MRGALLVASTSTRGAPARIAPTSGAASTRCSKLSRISSRLRLADILAAMSTTIDTGQPVVTLINTFTVAPAGRTARRRARAHPSRGGATPAAARRASRRPHLAGSRHRSRREGGGLDRRAARDAAAAGRVLVPRPYHGRTPRRAVRAPSLL